MCKLVVGEGYLIYTDYEVNIIPLKKGIYYIIPIDDIQKDFKNLEVKLK